jgi:hypothetical protein
MVSDRPIRNEPLLNIVILDPLHVGRWAKGQFGVKSSVVAVFMTHAVINENSNASQRSNGME